MPFDRPTEELSPRLLAASRSPSRFSLALCEARARPILVSQAREEAWKEEAPSRKKRTCFEGNKETGSKQSKGWKMRAGGGASADRALQRNSEITFSLSLSQDTAEERAPLALVFLPCLSLSPLLLSPSTSLSRAQRKHIREHSVCISLPPW